MTRIVVANIVHYELVEDAVIFLLVDEGKEIHLSLVVFLELTKRYTQFSKFIFILILASFSKIGFLSLSLLSLVVLAGLLLQVLELVLFDFGELDLFK